MAKAPGALSLHPPCPSPPVPPVQELRDLLAKHRDWLCNLLAAPSASATPSSPPGEGRQLLSRLMAALLRCVDPEGQRSPKGLQAQQLCAQCLGLLGAVDPARLDVQLDAPQPPVSGELGLMLQVVQRHLVRILRAAPDLGTLEMATFAIQELLRLAAQLPASAGAAADVASLGADALDADGGGVSTMAPTASAAAEPMAVDGPRAGNPLYERLPEDTRRVVRPYLDSKYELRSARAKPLLGAVFGGDSIGGAAGGGGGGLSFRRWLYLWMKQLVDNHATGASGVGVVGACM